MPDHNAGTRLSLGARPHFAPSLLRLCFELARKSLLRELAQSEPGDVIAVLANLRSHEVSALRLRPQPFEPASVVIGRHEQAGLRLSRDPSLALRHALLVASCSNTGGTVLRLFELRTGQGLLSFDMERRASLIAQRPACAVLGASTLFVVPAGLDPAVLSSFSDAGWSEPEAFVPEDEPDDSIPPGHAPSDALAAVLHLEPRTSLPVDIDLTLPRLKRGVLIGRYDRCDALHEDIDAHHAVSRVHALLVSVDKKPWLFDLASTNGIETEAGERIQAAALSTTAASRFCLGTLTLTFRPMAKVAE